MPVNSNIKKIILFWGDVPFLLIYGLVIVLTYVGVFDFLYSWPLVLSYLFFLLLTVLIFVPSDILSELTLYSIIKERHCTRLVCSSETPKAGLEGLGKMLDVKDRVAEALLSSVGGAVVPFAVLGLKGIMDGVYPSDALPLFSALFPWSGLWTFLVRLIRFRKYRYAEGLSFREALQELMPYVDGKKFGSRAFLYAILTLAVYWMSNAVIVFVEEYPPAGFYHFIVVFAASMATPVVLAVVVGWVLDVFTRRLFGEALGKFLFSSFVAGAVFHPLLGVTTSFLFSWAMFGKAKDAAAATAIAALSLFAVMLSELILTSVWLL